MTSRVDPRVRFWAKVSLNGPTPAHRPDLGPCAVWTASTNDHGYPIFRADTSGDDRVYARKWLWELVHARPVREGYTLDHLCHDWRTCPGGRFDPCRLCVGYWHAEEVPDRVNVVDRSVGGPGVNARKTVCDHGHNLLAPENVRIHPQRGHRDCRICHRLRKAGLLPASGQLALPIAV